MDTDALFRIFLHDQTDHHGGGDDPLRGRRLPLGDPVAKYLPELADMQLLIDGETVPPQSQMTIEQLMTHTAGLTNGWHVEHPVERAYRDAALHQSPNLTPLSKTLQRSPCALSPAPDTTTAWRLTCWVHWWSD